MVIFNKPLDPFGPIYECKHQSIEYLNKTSTSPKLELCVLIDSLLFLESQRRSPELSTSDIDEQLSTGWSHPHAQVPKHLATGLSF